ncbi:hypothetical protein DMB90_08760 [Raoultella planticola]|uniref:Uncharacterized protein n=1 Tax=Raoultella planticola TaxID=575 RepID=A0A5P6A9J5_RAOPL|nr:hypothetical protein DMB90_08760 [Raoultella planticola]
MYYAYTQRTIFNTVTMDFDGLVADDFMFSDQAVTTFKYMVNTIANRPFILTAIQHLVVLVQLLRAIH